MLMARQYTTHAPMFERPINEPHRRTVRKPPMRFGDYADLRFAQICNGGKGGPRDASPVVEALEPGELVAAFLSCLDDDGCMKVKTPAGIAPTVESVRQSVVDMAFREGVTICDWSPSDYLRDGLLS